FSPTRPSPIPHEALALITEKTAVGAGADLDFVGFPQRSQRLLDLPHLRRCDIWIVLAEEAQDQALQLSFDVERRHRHVCGDAAAVERYRCLDFGAQVTGSQTGDRAAHTEPNDADAFAVDELLRLQMANAASQVG